jgi:hypothetical protein
LADPLTFNEVWVVRLQKAEADEYGYNIVYLHIANGGAPIMRVRL